MPIVLRTLNEDDIMRLVPLAMKEDGDRRPVFKVTFMDLSSIVIKAESVGNGGIESNQDLIWGGKLMRQVSPEMKVQLLADHELAMLRRIANEQILSVDMHARGREYLRQLTLPEAAQVFKWVKLPYIPGMHDGEGPLERGGDAVAFYRALKQKEALRKLGRIIAIDLFIGNGDRFCPVTGEVVNPGNIIYQRLANGATNMIGLDYYESMSMDSHFLRNLEPTWGGRHLRSRPSVDAFAKLVKYGLNAKFAEAGIVKRLKSSYEIAVGMRQGVDAIRQYLNSRDARGKGMNPGVRHRAAVLGWVAA